MLNKENDVEANGTSSIVHQGEDLLINTNSKEGFGVSASPLMKSDERKGLSSSKLRKMEPVESETDGNSSMMVTPVIRSARSVLVPTTNGVVPSVNGEEQHEVKYRWGIKPGTKKYQAYLSFLTLGVIYGDILVQAHYIHFRPLSQTLLQPKTPSSEHCQ